MYNPFDGVSPYTLSCNWACHTAAGYLGGDDYATGVNSGYPVKAAMAGTVTVATFDCDGHGSSLFTITDGSVQSCYMHMKQFNFAVGDDVSEGDVVGLSGGKTGDLGKGVATGPHCHWHLIIDGTRTDPLAYLAANGSSGGDDMPTLSSALDSGSHSLTANTWTQFQVDSTNAGNYSFVQDQATVDAQVDFHLTGVTAGTVIQAQFLQVDHSNSDAIYKAYNIHEWVAVSSGDFYGSFADKLGIQSGSQWRGRARIMVDQSGITQARSEFRWLQW